MDAKTAITLQQKARKKARKGAIAGGCGCPSGATNVNDMRYSCQGFMGRSVRSASASLAEPNGRAVAGGVFPCNPCGPCAYTHCLPCDPACDEDGCQPGGGGVGTPGDYMGGVFPCNPCGPCAFTHCLPCDPACDDGWCPPNGNGGGVGTPGAYTGRGMAGGVLPYDECGPCQLAHCIGCGTPIAGYAAGPFPPTCDCCAPCMYSSTCTPCEGPQRSQRWGNQWSPDDFGGRMCFRPCAPDPCCGDVPPPPGKIPPGKKVPPGGKLPPPRIPKKPPGKKPCPPGWIRPRGSNFCVPGKLTSPKPTCPPDTVCCVIAIGDYLILKCEDTSHPWHGMDVTHLGNCYGSNGNTVCAIQWKDECGEHWLELPLCIQPKNGLSLSAVPVPKQPPNGGSAIPRPGGVPTASDWITAVPMAPPSSSAPQPSSPTPKVATLALAGGRVGSPSHGVGRR